MPLKSKNSSKFGDVKNQISESADKYLVVVNDPHSVESEQFRMMRSTILFPPTGQSPRTIMITSSLPGEGKSFVSANLAVCIAHHVDKHVLLMDCDIRLPSIHEIFGFENPPGISELLSDKTDISDIFLKTKIDRLTIAPAGEPPPNPSELLSSSKMASLIEDVKSKYSDRCILIDTPPVQLTAETAAIAKHVDAVILVIRYGKTPRALIPSIVEKIGKKKVMGIVLNRAEMISLLDYKKNLYEQYGKYYRK